MFCIILLKINEYTNTYSNSCQVCKCICCQVVYTHRLLPGMTDTLTHSLRRKAGHPDRHFNYTASCVRTTLAPPTETLGCHKIQTNIGVPMKTVGL